MVSFYGWEQQEKGGSITIWLMLDLLGVGFGELLISIGLVRFFMAFWLVAIGEGFVVVVYLSFGQLGLCGLWGRGLRELIQGAALLGGQGACPDNGQSSRAVHSLGLLLAKLRSSK